MTSEDGTCFFSMSKTSFRGSLVTPIATRMEKNELTATQTSEVDVMIGCVEHVDGSCGLPYISGLRCLQEAEGAM